MRSLQNWSGIDSSLFLIASKQEKFEIYVKTINLSLRSRKFAKQYISHKGWAAGANVVAYLPPSIFELFVLYDVTKLVKGSASIILVPWPIYFSHVI